ncbi:hypothetical protein ACWD60_33920, partial [Streptomyces sp. NPDC005167]
MNIRLHFRLFAATAGTGLVLTACGSSGSPPSASGSPSAAPGTSSPSATVSVPSGPSAITPPGTPLPTTPGPGGGAPPLGSGRFQPMWPFTTLAEARAWERDFHSAGHQPWHLDPVRLVDVTLDRVLHTLLRLRVERGADREAAP